MVRTPPASSQGAHAGFLLNWAMSVADPKQKCSAWLIVSLGSQIVLWEFRAGLWAVVVRKVSFSLGSERDGAWVSLGQLRVRPQWSSMLKHTASSPFSCGHDLGPCFPPTRGKASPCLLFFQLPSLTLNLLQSRSS